MQLMIRYELDCLIRYLGDHSMTTTELATVTDRAFV